MPHCLYSENLHCYVDELLDFFISLAKEANADIFMKTLLKDRSLKCFVWSQCLLSFSLFVVMKMFISTASHEWDNFS